MTATTPNYRVIADDGVMSTVEYDLPGFTKGQTVMKSRLVGTPDGDDILRRRVAALLATQDILRGEL